MPADLQFHAALDLGKAQASLTQFAGQVDHTTARMNAAGGSTGGLAGGLTSLINPATLALGAAAGLGVALGDTVGKAADFEQQMSKIKATTGDAGPPLDNLRNLALQLGMATDVGSVSASDAAGAIFELSKAGVKAEDQLGGATKAALQLAAAAGPEFGIANAATLAADAMNTFNLKGTDTAHIADVLVGAANASSIGLQELKFSFSAVGAVANTVGLSIEDTSTAIAVLGQNGLKGSDAGTSLKTMLMRLNPTTKAATQAMQDVGLWTAKSGSAFFDASGHVKSMDAIAGELQDALGGLTKEQQLSTMTTIFGSDAVRAAAILTREGATGIRDMAGEMLTQGHAAEAAAAMNDNFKGKMEALTGTIETIQIQIGTALLPVLTSLAEGFNALISSNEAQTFFNGLATGIPAVIEFIGSLGSALGALLGTITPIEPPATAVAIAATNAGSAFNAFAAAASGLAPPVDAVGAAIQTLMDIASGLAETIGTGGFGAIAPAITGALPDILSSLQTIGQGLITQAADWAIKAVSWVTDAIPGLVANLAAFGATLFNWLTSEGIPKAAQFLMDLAQKFIDWIVPAIPGMVAQLTAWGTALLGWVLNEGIPKAVALLVTLGTKFVEWIVPNIPPMLAAIGSLGTALFTWITGTALPMILGKLQQWATAFVAWVGPQIPPLLAKLGELLGQLVAWSVNVALPALLLQLGTWAAAFVQWVVDATPIMVGKLVEFGAALLKWIADEGLPQLAKALEGMATALKQWILDTVPKVPGALEEFARSLRDWVQHEGIPKVLKFFTDLGNNIIAGIEKGLGMNAGAIVDFIVNLAKDAEDAIKRFFGISSPSKLMIKDFGYIGKGALIGLQRTMPAAVDYLKDQMGTVGGLTGGMMSVTGTVSGSRAATSSTAHGAPVQITLVQNDSGSWSVGNRSSRGIALSVLTSGGQL